MAVKRPPNVKALIVRVPDKAWMVPPALKLIWLPAVPREILPLETLKPVVAWRPLDNSREPEKELEPVPAEKIKPEVLKEPAVTELVTVKDLVMFKLPAKELEPVEVPTTVPLTVRLPPMEAKLPTSRLLETEELV